MKILKKKRCIIGEGPIWNERENCLYFTNGMENEICKYDLKKATLTVIPTKNSCAAIAFGKENEIIVSQNGGVFVLNNDGSTKELYDRKKYDIKFANDMKVGPDGRIYVGTQSEKRMGISDKINGKLYSIDKYGNVMTLLTDLRLSNGMDWSFDEKFFYHTDSDTQIIKEYAFEKEKGELCYTGRQLTVPGVDGFTMGSDNRLYIACWGRGHIAVADTKKFVVEKYIEIPCNIPASCCFCTNTLDVLAVTTASCETDIKKDKNAGFTVLKKINQKGRKPYLFG